MDINANDSLQQTLKAACGEKAAVEVQLRGGHVVKGRVTGVGPEFVVIGSIAGREFSDAQVRIADIAALCVQVRSK